GDPFGLKHLVRIRPHAGELPLTHRLADSAVDARGPAALLWVFDLDGHAPDAFNFDRPGFAVLHRTEPLVVGAAGEHVAGLKGRDLRRPGNNLANRVLHVLGVVILTQLVVLPKLHTQFLWIWHLIPSYDPRSHRAKRIRRLVKKEHPRPQPTR